MRQEVFRMERVTYLDKGSRQLEDFNLQIYRGEIMGMIPISAHGLQALLQLMQTNMPLYDGHVYYCGERVNSWKSTRRSVNRIGVIDAHSRLVEHMTVSDNIFVLRQGFRQNIIKNKLLQRQLAPFMQDIGMQIPADAYVDGLSAFERVTVELLRAVVAGYRLIVLREISTVINGDELAKLYGIMQHYAGQGFSFLYISLHLEEIMEVCDRVALLYNGRIQKVAQRAEMKSEIVQSYTVEFDKMIHYHMGQRNTAEQARKRVLSLSHIAGGALTDFALEVYEGECLVVQSLDEQVLRDILSVLGGDRKPGKGEVCMEGKPIHPVFCRDFALISADPTKTMIFPGMSYLDNLCMGLSRRVPDIWKNSRMKNSVRKEYAASLGEEVFSLPVEALGEKQKYQLVYTRVLLQKPKVVVCVQPFKGADLTHRVLIWKMMEMLLDKGMAVVILTINLADSMSLADRLIRVGKDGFVQEVEKKNFGSLPVAAPWIDLYR
ncbi:MAG TPA: sugar ABC transporter ATP-binding protein [Lachnospiraceae bacterium]|nr:sugar ABC transporter ATP-binding protein [Lachnospiraceae bacterium]